MAATTSHTRHWSAPGPGSGTWLDEDRTGQQIRRHLAMSAAGWEALGRADTELYRGARLGSALEWLERGHEPLAEVERAFIEASRAVADDQVRRMAEDARRQRRQNRRLRGLVAVATVLLVVAAGAGVVARNQGLDAQRGRDSVRAAAAAARHQSLVALSLALRQTNRAVAAMLAVLAWRQDPDPLAQSALQGVLSSEADFLGYRFIPLAIPPSSSSATLGAPAAAAVPHEDRMLMAVGSSVELRDPDTGATTAAFTRPLADQEGSSVLRVSADGTRAVQLLFTGGGRCPPACHTLVVYDLATHEHVGAPIDVPFRATDVAISHDGSLVAASGGEDERWDVATWGATSGRQVAHARRGASAVAFGAGDIAYLGTSEGPVQEVDARTLDVRRVLTAPRGFTGARLLKVDGVLFAAGNSGQAAFDLRAGRRRWPIGADRVQAMHGCRSLAVSSRLQSVYCGLVTGLVEERNLRTGELTGRVRFDPQFGRGGDLVLDRTASGAQVLLEVSAEKPYYARWQLAPDVGHRQPTRGEASVASACSLAGRNPTLDEWATYVGDTVPYVEVCPSFPPEIWQRTRGEQ